jgi:hypothetical protein
VRSLSDAELLRRLFASLKQSRRDEVGLITLIAEVDARKLYAREAKPSMFQYCTEVLHLSEQEAYLRITVARASRQHPQILSMLRDGRLHLSGVARLTKHLTPENRDEVLRRATHRTRRQIEDLVAELEPQPDRPPSMRKLPSRGTTAAVVPSGTTGPQGPGSNGAGPALMTDMPSGDGAAFASGDPRFTALGGPTSTPQLCPDRAPIAPGAASAPPATMRPVAQDRYRVEFTATAKLREKLVRLQDLMRSSVPDGDLGRIIDAAVTEKLERLEARRFARTKSPRKRVEETDTTPSSRHVPAPVRRAVHQRDGGRCTYRDVRGRRCTARDRLEFHHHDRAFGRGGEHSVANVRLMCRTHNLLLAEQEYGKERMARYRRRNNRVSEPTAGHGGRARQGASEPP